MLPINRNGKLGVLKNPLKKDVAAARLLSRFITTDSFWWALLWRWAHLDMVGHCTDRPVLHSIETARIVRHQWWSKALLWRPCAEAFSNRTDNYSLTFWPTYPVDHLCPVVLLFAIAPSSPCPLSQYNAQNSKDLTPSVKNDYCVLFIRLEPK